MGAGASARIQDGIINGDRMDDVAHKCESLFEDEEFDPNCDLEILGPRFRRENDREGGITEADVHWVRPPQFGPGHLFNPGFEAPDSTACIGALDALNRDLVVVAQAICARRPDYLKSIIVGYNPVVGCAAIRLFHDGRFELVVVDDRIPCMRRLRNPHLPKDPFLDEYDYEPISCRLRTGEAWLPLLEKALAKLHGSYTATALGDGTRDLFRDLCGGEHVIDINLTQMDPQGQKHLFRALLPRFERGELLLVARKSGHSARTWASPHRVNAVLSLVKQSSHHHLEPGGTLTEKKKKYAAAAGAKKKENVEGEGGRMDFSEVPEDLVRRTTEEEVRKDEYSLEYDMYAEDGNLHGTSHEHGPLKNKHRSPSHHYFICLGQDEDPRPSVDEQKLDIHADLVHKINDAKISYPEALHSKHKENEAALLKAEHGHHHADVATGQDSVDWGETAEECEQDARSFAMEHKKKRAQWLSWTQFCEDYAQLSVCVVVQEGHPCKESFGIQSSLPQAMKSRWDPKAGTSGGRYGLKSWRNSPLFRIKMTKFKACRGRLLVTTSLPDARRESFYGDTVADLDSWDGDQHRGGELLYVSHSLFICQDEPTLEKIVVNTDYRQQRDVTVEMELDCTANGPFSFVVVPSTYADEVSSEFIVSALFVEENGRRREVTIEPLEVWKGYNFTAKVTGKWIKGETAMGQVSKHNPFSFLNPTFRMVIAGTDGGDYDSVDGANHLDKLIAQRLAEQSVSMADPAEGGQFAQDEYENGYGYDNYGYEKQQAYSEFDGGEGEGEGEGGSNQEEKGGNYDASGPKLNEGEEGAGQGFAPIRDGDGPGRAGAFAGAFASEQLPDVQYDVEYSVQPVITRTTNMTNGGEQADRVRAYTQEQKEVDDVGVMRMSALMDASISIDPPSLSSQQSMPSMPLNNPHLNENQLREQVQAQAQTAPLPGYTEHQLGYHDVHKLNASTEHVSVVSDLHSHGPYGRSRLKRKEDKPTVRHFQVCTLLSPSSETDGPPSRGNTPTGSRRGSRAHSPANSEVDFGGGADTDRGGLMAGGLQYKLPRSGTYLMTPNAYSKLVHNQGACGDLHVNDGFLGRFRFNSYPVTTRHEKFCVFNGGVNGGNVLHRGGDVYEEMVVMCALETKDLTGSFTLEVISNLPFRLEPMELSTVSAPLRELKNAKNKQKGLGGTPCSPQRVRVTAQDFNARLDEIAANGKEVQIPESARDTEAAMRNNNSNTIGNANMPSPYPTPRPVALSNNAMANNGPSTPAAGAKVPTVSGSRKNASRARVSDEDTNPKYGVGNQEMPTFDRNVLTSTIKATTYRAEDDPDAIPKFVRMEENVERTIEDEKYGTVHTSILPLQGTLAEPPRPRNDDDDDDSEEWVEKAIDYFEGGHKDSIRHQLPTIRQSISKQIKRDTDRRINACTIAMFSNESKLERQIKNQYEEYERRKAAGLEVDEENEGMTAFYKPMKGYDRIG